MNRYPLAVGLCALGLAVAASTLVLPVEAKTRWFKLAGSNGANLCMNLETVHIKQDFVIFKYGEAAMDDCDDDPFFGGTTSLAIRSGDCRAHLSAGGLALYKEENGEDKWQEHSYGKDTPEFTMAGVACNWAYPSLFGQQDSSTVRGNSKEAARPNSEIASPARRGPSGGRTADCRRVIGAWTWFTGAIKTFKPTGTVDGADDSGHWVCSGGHYVVTWSSGWVDRLTLSSNGIELSGVNQWGHSVSAVRR